MDFIISGAVAVIAMTIFSALYNFFTKDEFREPNLLTQIFKKLFQSTSDRRLLVFGWITHFLIGYIFLGLYEVAWWYLETPRNFDMAILFGLASGFLGIIGWELMFKMVRFKKRFSYGHYYFHLVLAHIVFSTVAMFGYIR